MDAGLGRGRKLRETSVQVSCWYSVKEWGRQSEGEVAPGTCEQNRVGWSRYSSGALRRLAVIESEVDKRLTRIFARDELEARGITVLQVWVVAFLELRRLVAASVPGGFSNGASGHLNAHWPGRGAYSCCPGFSRLKPRPGEPALCGRQ